MICLNEPSIWCPTIHTVRVAENAVVKLEADVGTEREEYRPGRILGVPESFLGCSRWVSREFSTVLSKIPEVVKSPPSLKRDEPSESESGFRYILHHNGDQNRELILTVLAFEVPIAIGERPSRQLGRNLRLRRPRRCGPNRLRQHARTSN